MISRRKFAAAGLTALCLPRTGVGSRRRIPVALQLFSVRKQGQENLAGILRQVAELGFQGVEFAGYYGHSAYELRGMLAANALTCCGAHVAFDELSGNRLEKTIGFHEALGNKRLVLPGLPHRLTTDAAAWTEAARTLRGISERLDGRMQLGYHNHSAEFKGEPGARPWDLLLQNTPHEVFMEMDLGGAGFGGADPIAELKRYPGRVRMVHVKDYTLSKPDLLIGDGAMDWKRFFPACRKAGRVDWFVIEHDSDPRAHLADIEESLRRFRDRENGGI